LYYTPNSLSSFCSNISCKVYVSSNDVRVREVKREGIGEDTVKISLRYSFGIRIEGMRENTNIPSLRCKYPFGRRSFRAKIWND
jgi:hypothetical protein